MFMREGIAKGFDMRADQIFMELKSISDKIGIRVVEKSFRNTGIKVESGLCRVKGKPVYILDRNISIHEKNKLLTDCLSAQDLNDVYVLPAVRMLFGKQNSDDS